MHKTNNGVFTTPVVIEHAKGISKRWTHVFADGSQGRIPTKTEMQCALQSSAIAMSIKPTDKIVVIDRNDRGDPEVWFGQVNDSGVLELEARLMPDTFGVNWKIYAKHRHPAPITVDGPIWV